MQNVCILRTQNRRALNGSLLCVPVLVMTLYLKLGVPIIGFNLIEGNSGKPHSFNLIITSVIYTYCLFISYIVG